MNNEKVLVTGGTGFIAQYCILVLLNHGFRVRATVRSLARESEVRQNLKEGGIDAGEKLSFVVADLTKEEGWDKAMSGCQYAIHCASSTPTGDQISEEDWINPAVEGTLRVLRHARDAGVKRVVMTSAFGAICAGHNQMKRPFNEGDWSDLSGKNVWLYQKSKTLSEKAAWDFIEQKGNCMELATINPVAVLGPVLGADYSHSIRIVKGMMDGQQGNPQINCGFVDVRDVADLHWRAMVQDAAKNQRFLATAGDSLWLSDVAKIIKKRMGKAAENVSTRTLPNWLVRLGALKDPALKGSIPLLGLNLNSTNEKAKSMLGWTPRTAEDAIVATAESLVNLGLIKS